MLCDGLALPGWVGRARGRLEYRVDVVRGYSILVIAGPSAARAAAAADSCIVLQLEQRLRVAFAIGTETPHVGLGKNGTRLRVVWRRSRWGVIPLQSRSDMSTTIRLLRNTKQQ